MHSELLPDQTSMPAACTRCAAPAPHEHGPCQDCHWYTLRRPGVPHFPRLPTCLHPTMREERVHRWGTSTVWGDVTVRNDSETCPTFRRRPPAARTRLTLS